MIGIGISFRLSHHPLLIFRDYQYVNRLALFPTLFATFQGQCERHVRFESARESDSESLVNNTITLRCFRILLNLFITSVELFFSYDNIVLVFDGRKKSPISVSHDMLNIEGGISCFKVRTYHAYQIIHA